MGVCNATDGSCFAMPLVGQLCDDGQFCSIGDTCNENGECAPSGINQECNFCVPGTEGCGCDTDSDCQELHGNFECRDNGTCVNNTCQYPANDTQTCDDGDACTVDVCADGSCDSSTPVDCDDQNGCTLDSCNNVTGCQNELVDEDCRPCTQDSDCATNEDGDACTIDVCLASGTCGVEPFDCPVYSTCNRTMCMPVGHCSKLPAKACQIDDDCSAFGYGFCVLKPTCLPQFAGPVTPCDDGTCALLRALLGRTLTRVRERARARARRRHLYGGRDVQFHDADVRG